MIHPNPSALPRILILNLYYFFLVDYCYIIVSSRIARVFQEEEETNSVYMYIYSSLLSTEKYREPRCAYLGTSQHHPNERDAPL